MAISKTIVLYYSTWNGKSQNPIGEKAKIQGNSPALQVQPFGRENGTDTEMALIDVGLGELIVSHLGKMVQMRPHQAHFSFSRSSAFKNAHFQQNPIKADHIHLCYFTARNWCLPIYQPIKQHTGPIGREFIVRSRHKFDFTCVIYLREIYLPHQETVSSHILFNLKLANNLMSNLNENQWTCSILNINSYFKHCHEVKSTCALTEFSALPDLHWRFFLSVKPPDSDHLQDQEKRSEGSSRERIFLRCSLSGNFEETKTKS